MKADLEQELAKLVVEVYRLREGVRMPVSQDVAQRCNESRHIWKNITSGQNPGMHERLQTMVRARVPAFDLAAFIASLAPRRGGALTEADSHRITHKVTDS